MVDLDAQSRALGITMKARHLLVLSVISLAGCQNVLKSEPPSGTLALGQKVLVDDGSCPKGQVKQVTGSVKGVPRQRQCVAEPK